MSNLLVEATPPDEDMVVLIEQAFSQDQIDGQKVDLAYLWLRGEILALKSAQIST